jgi:hypothetical protein
MELQDFNFFNNDADRRTRMQSPMYVYLSPKKRTGGIVVLNLDWMKTRELPNNRIALQIDGTGNSFIMFNPPPDVSVLTKRDTGTQNVYSGTAAARALIRTFANKDANRCNLFLKKVGTFGAGVVYQITNRASQSQNGH